MGLSIHYSGYLKKANLLPELIREVKDVAEIYEWKYQIFDTVFPDEQFQKEVDFDNLYGISFRPPDSETISLVFLSNGRMVCPASVSFFKKDVTDYEESWIYTTSVKTQYAGVRVHQVIILFFRYLNDKYFRDFEMMDESYYWETNDEAKMIEQFNTLNALIDRKSVV